MEIIQKATLVGEIAKLQLDKFNKSRDIEWKMNFTLWGLIVGTGAALLGHYHPTFNAFIMVFVITTFWHFLWLVKMQQSQDKDLAYYLTCREQLFNLINDKLPNFKIDEKEPSLNVFWPFGDAVVTAFLIAAVCFILTKTPLSNPT